MYLKKINLKNKTAVVTGAGKGIGKACAIALAEAGANLIIISRTQRDLNEVSKIKGDWKASRKVKARIKAFESDIKMYEDRAEQECLEDDGWMIRTKKKVSTGYEGGETFVYNTDEEKLVRCIEFKLKFENGWISYMYRPLIIKYKKYLRENRV